MSELTREKIYRNELIKAGATGNNNLERIRSLQNGGGGGTGKVNETLSTISEYQLADVGVASVGDYIYLFGGKKNGVVQNTIVKLNSKTLQAETLNVTLDYRTYSMTAVAIGGFVYAFGGRIIDGNTDTTNAKFYCFDTAKETISELSSWGFVLNGATIGNYIYALNTTGDLCEIDVVNKQSKRVLINYFPTYLYGSKIASVGSNLYILGGEHFSKIYKYNVISNLVTELTFEFETEFASMAVSTIGSNIYIFGGLKMLNPQLACDSIYKIDTIKDEVKLLSLKLPIPAYNIGTTSIGSDVYLFGGRDGATEYSNVQKFTVEF